MKKQTKWEENLRNKIGWISTLSVLIFALIFFGRIAYLALVENYWKEISLDHFPTIVGLPAAAIASVFIVIALRTVAGPIELKIGSIELKGASGPTMLWLFCFLSICLAIRMTWNLT